MTAGEKIKSAIWVFIKYFSVIFFSFVAVLPIVSCVITAFKTDTEYQSTNVMTPPESWFNFQNFVDAFRKANMGRAFLNSAIVVVAVVAGSVLIGSMLAYVLSRFKFPGNGLIRNLFLFATLLPGIAMQVSTYQMMDLIADKIYHPELHRQEVFFDDKWNSIIDLHSYGHDIETAWLVDRSLEVIEEKSYEEKLSPITKDLTNQIYKVAFDGNSLANECEKGVVNEWRIWWVQAETVVGFLNGYQKSGRKEYLEAAEKVWSFIKSHLIDQREGYAAGREWYWRVEADRTPDREMPIVEPWKCPYHNGRMCFEVIKRFTI